LKTLEFFEAKREVFGLPKHLVQACNMYDCDPELLIVMQIRIILGNLRI
jgi:hypothetical protein